MELFARLFAELDHTNKTNEKVEAIARYFHAADPASAAWGLYFLSGQKLQRLVSSSLLRQWAIEVAEIEAWLFDECYEAVGDLAETISLVVPRPIETNTVGSLSQWVEEHLLPLRRLTVAEQRERIVASWRQLNQVACLVLNKLLTGSFRVGVSQKLVIRGLAVASGVEAEVLAHRLMGTWTPGAEFFRGLLSADQHDAQVSRPYPFFLANPLEVGPGDLGDIRDWQVEWKWDGIRAQVVRRQGQTYIWSRGEELMAERFPELESQAEQLPDGTVLDGEVVGFHQRVILPFLQLQRRIGRKRLGKKILSEVPVAYLMFDILEWRGQDVRGQPLRERRLLLESLAEDLRSKRKALLATNPDSLLKMFEESAGREGPGTGVTAPGALGDQHQLGWADENGIHFLLPPRVESRSWEELAEIRGHARQMQAEGLMLKRLDSPYRVGRPRGDWWKWKIQPYTVDAVLIYAQRGHGKRASLYTDYTFGVWDGEALVPFAKAYSGLTDAEISAVDRFVRQNTTERFGPVRSVKPELVFELAFESIQLSTRHRSGIAVRFPRILRWRHDKAISDADSLATIRAMLASLTPSP